MRKAHQKAYVAWKALRGRCLNPKNREYHRYGGRAITVCERWGSFENFLEDMGSPPEKNRGWSIDRINNEYGYEKSNCRWTEAKQQARNRRTTRWLTIKGDSKSMAEWGEKYGIDPDTIWMRLKYGWTHEAAVTRPVRAHRAYQKP